MRTLKDMQCDAAIARVPVWAAQPVDTMIKTIHALSLDVDTLARALEMAVGAYVYESHGYEKEDVPEQVNDFLAQAQEVAE